MSMTSNEAFAKLTEILNESFSPSFDILDVTTFEELGMDSLDVIELIMAVEEDFEIEISDEEVEDQLAITSTVQDGADFILARIS